VKKKFNFISLSQIDSTNNYAKNLIENNKNIDEWTVIDTKFQFAGRGQEGNTWESENNKNLTFSIILKPDFLKPSNQFKLNKVISLGVVDFLQKYSIANVKIKWPNDIYVENKKIAGILLENIISGDKYSFCIAGIGVNINQENFSEKITNFTSLKKITGKEYIRRQCLNVLLNCLYARYYQLVKSPEIIDCDYHNNLYLLEEKRKYIIKNTKTVATIKGINEYGLLQLQKDDNSIIYCDFKEIIFLSVEE